MNLNEVIEFINGCSDDTKVYIGCDSYRKRKNKQWFAHYTTVVVVHVDGSRGCKIFYEKSSEVDYDQKKNRPQMRMMNEVYKASEMFLTLSPHIERDIEIHVDINPDECHGSSCAYSQALGYIQGVCGVKPKFKPDAWAASKGADRGKRLNDSESINISA